MCHHQRNVSTDVATPERRPSLSMPSCRSVLVRLFAVSALVQVAVTWFVHSYVNKPIFPDAETYDQYGRTIALGIDRGMIAMSELVKATGSRSWGVHAFFGYIYYLFGADWLYAKLGLALVAASAPVAVYVLARRILSSRTAIRFAVIATLLFPTSFFWSAMGLKDAAVAALALDILAIQASVRDPWGMCIGLGAAAALLPVRPATAGALVLAIIFSRGARDGRRNRALRIAAGAVVLAAVVLPTGQRLAGGTLLFPSSAEVGFAIGNEGRIELSGGLPSQVFRAVQPIHIFRGLMSPRPWAIDEETASPYRWMYPGTAIWIILLPAAILGAVLATRRGLGASRALVLFAALYGLAYYVTFTDGFARQRTQVELIGLLFAALAFSDRSRLALGLTSAWVCVVAWAAVLETQPVAGAVVGVVGLSWLLVWRRRQRPEGSRVLGDLSWQHG